MTTFTPNTDLDLVLCVDRTRTARAVVPPAPWKTIACDLDVRPGGRFNTTMESPEGEHYPNRGCVLEVDPGKLLVLASVLGEDFRPVAPSNGADDLPFTARVSIVAVPGGTQYTAVAMHPDVATRQRHEEMGFHDGWGAALDQLVALLG